jgi:hypothetical protein
MAIELAVRNCWSEYLCRCARFGRLESRATTFLALLQIGPSVITLIRPQFTCKQTRSRVLITSKPTIIITIQRRLCLL